MMTRSWPAALWACRFGSRDNIPGRSPNNSPPNRCVCVRPDRGRSGRLLVATLLLAMLGGAAAPPANAVEDPLEPLNRGIFEFNRIADGLVLKPASQLYELAVPEPGRRAVTNVLSNLRGPVVFINHLLQGDREMAGITFGRFFVNSTLGLLGIFDAASVFGVEPRREADFGQTLGAWGVGGGAYLVLPLFGPSTLRDAGGLAVDTFLFDPFPYLSESEWQLARWGATSIDTRYRFGPLLDDIEAASLDFYVATRTAFLQNRAAQIRGRSDVRDEAYESIFDQEFENGFGDDDGIGAGPAADEPGPDGG